MHFLARSTAVVFAGLVASIVGAIVWAPAASAGSNESIVTARGSVSFFHSGDKLLACDAKKDGLSIEGHFQFVDSGSPHEILHAAGVGNCDSGVWDTYEGADIEIRMCYRKDFVITKCSGWQRAEM